MVRIAWQRKSVHPMADGWRRGKEGKKGEKEGVTEKDPKTQLRQ